MQIADPLGLPGAPQETLNAVLAHLEQHPSGGAGGPAGQLILVTDRQGERDRAGYAAVLIVGSVATVVATAFGPRFGRPGMEALVQLVHWAQEREWMVRETVLNSSDFTRVIDEPDAAEVGRLVAASSPSDTGIYLVWPAAWKEESWQA
ncbi:hypothetical protein GCM10010840_29460 [Deinococcus aerolatus]|uniref:DUF3197 domain-containing protein n=1 Tax=Deinococcus aerolatus TaxID=522487 RepID=A0ABQ2GEK1_9DEIO|nr:DUF3197 domain-containing protein [Deinococcus aerolatus]GGL89464.1 hypothetical protein GCM10010840_29460 [Deinococcus aerolatus]